MPRFYSKESSLMCLAGGQIAYVGPAKNPVAGNPGGEVSQTAGVNAKPQRPKWKNHRRGRPQKQHQKVSTPTDDQLTNFVETSRDNCFVLGLLFAPDLRHQLCVFCLSGFNQHFVFCVRSGHCHLQ